MNTKTDIITNGKKRGVESFNHERLRDSIMAACLSARALEAQAENIAERVCDSVEQWLENFSEITHQDLRVVTHQKLKKYHPDAAYLYQQRYTML